MFYSILVLLFSSSALCVFNLVRFFIFSVKSFESKELLDLETLFRVRVRERSWNSVLFEIMMGVCVMREGHELL